MANIVIVGASGMIGQAFFQTFTKYFTTAESSRIKFHLLASPKSAGKEVRWQEKSITLENIETFDFKTADLCFFALHEDFTKKYINKARKYAKLIIDLSSAYRQDPAVPLIIPEINLHSWEKLGKPNLVANPNCTTIGLLLSLQPLLDLYTIKRLDIATYQSISGQGTEKLIEFCESINAHGIHSEKMDLNPKIGTIHENGYSTEEMKVINESQKILHPIQIPLTIGCVRVPVHSGHGAWVSVECKQPIYLTDIQEQAQQYPWLMAKPKQIYTPKKHVKDSPWIYLSRLKKDRFNEKRMSYWQLSNNIIRGGVYNALMVAAKLTNLIEQKAANNHNACLVD